jgi:hypothetical protein
MLTQDEKMLFCVFWGFKEWFSYLLVYSQNPQKEVPVIMVILDI